MNRPWLLVVAAGLSAGVLGGPLAAIGVAAVTSAGSWLARRPWWLVGLVALAAGLTGAARGAAVDLPVLDPAVAQAELAEGRVVSVPQMGPSGPRAVVAVERVGTEDGEWTQARGRVLVFFGETASNGIGKGDRIRVVWAVTPVSEVESGFRRFVYSSGAQADAWVFHTRVLERGADRVNVLGRLRQQVTERLEGIGGDGGALLAGFVTGDDSGLSAAARDAFERTNTSHITAVSGSNVAVLVTIWLTVMRRQRFQRAIWGLAILLALIWAYVALVGFGPGAVRAGLFATVMLPAARFGRRPDPLTALVLASAIMLLVRPAFADNLGFWLSFAASGAMVTVIGGQRHEPAWLQGVVALVAAQIATFPIVFWAFGGWSPGSLVANLLLGPLVAVVFPFAFLAAVVLVAAPWLTDLLGWIPKLGADAIVALAESLADAFPLLRAGTGTPTLLVLLAVLCALLIGAMSVDVQRWLRRVAIARAIATAPASAAILGFGVGVWLAALVLLGVV